VACGDLSGFDSDRNYALDEMLRSPFPDAPTESTDEDDDERVAYADTATVYAEHVARLDLTATSTLASSAYKALPPVQVGTRTRSTVLNHYTATNCFRLRDGVRVEKQRSTTATCA
jgi:hypothetical protein